VLAMVLALASAATYGAADFMGGLAAKRTQTLLVVAISQLAGFVVVLVLAGPLGGTPHPRDLALGAAAGAVGALALTVFYRALAQGSMSVVAPVTAVCTALVPVVAGLATGDAVGAPALAGFALALPAVALVAGVGPLSSLRMELSSFVAALVAGTAFGIVLLLLHASSEDSGLWPLVAARVASALAIGVLLAVRRIPVRMSPRALPLIVAAGVADMTANALFLVAVRDGPLSVVGLLSSLYPVSTVVLATLLLRERLTPAQLAGVGGCAVAVALIASS
jgi:drug/metabolite transporter (DMT)-like permease